jgi:hypothetical protein
MKNIVQINEGDNQMQRKEKGEKNDQNKGIKTLKKKFGINLQTDFFNTRNSVNIY